MDMIAPSIATPTGIADEDLDVKYSGPRMEYPSPKLGDEEVSECESDMYCNRYELVELSLKRRGYDPVQRYTFSHESKPSECYIKCRSQYGFYVFVLIDECSLVSFSKNDLAIVENRKANAVDIPASVKRGIYANAMGDVMAECSGGICKLGHNPQSTDPIETTFTFVNPNIPNRIIPQGSILSYPVVRLSEIKADLPNDVVLERALGETVRMRSLAYNEAKQDIKNFMLVKDGVSQITTIYAGKYNEIRDIISRDVPLYTERQHQFILNPPQTDDELTAQRMNEAQLAMINDTFVSYIASTHKFRALSRELNRIGQNIVELSEQLDTYILRLTSPVHLPIL